MAKKPVIIGIYKITSPSVEVEGGRIYIGQSGDIYGRFRQYERLTNCSEQTFLFNSLEKYGFNNHKSEIIESFETYDQKQLDEREIFHIALFNTFNSEHGMNLTSGGANGKASDETKRKMSEAHKRRYAENPSKLKGRKLSDEHKLRVSIAGKGRITSEETKKKMSISAMGKNKGKKHSEETKKAWSIARTGEKNANYKNGSRTKVK